MGAIELYGAVSGEVASPPLVILHGLLGSSRNWAGITRALEKDFRVHALDLRNHGQSPHAATMDYESMVADILAYCDRHEIASFRLIGHSMGGKAAMLLACRHPERVQALVVVDIAPKHYPPHWEKEFRALRALEVEHFSRRQEAEDALKGSVSDWAFRQFFLTNLERRPEGGFRWVVNLPVLQASLPELFADPLKGSDVYEGPTLFLRGAQSGYVGEDAESAIQVHFPQAGLETVADAGHNVHFEQPESFLSLVRPLLEG